VERRFNSEEVGYSYVSGCMTLTLYGYSIPFNSTLLAENWFATYSRSLLYTQQASLVGVSPSWHRTITGQVLLLQHWTKNHLAWFR